MNLQEGIKCHIYAKIYCFNGFKAPPWAVFFTQKKLEGIPNFLSAREIV